MSSFEKQDIASTEQEEQKMTNPEKMVERFSEMSREIGNDLGLGVGSQKIAESAINLTDEEIERRIMESVKNKKSGIGRWVRMALVSAFMALPALQAKANDFDKITTRAGDAFSELEEKINQYKQDQLREATAITTQQKKDSSATVKKERENSADTIIVNEVLTYEDQQALVPKINIEAALKFPGRTLSDSMLRTVIALEARKIGAYRKALANAQKENDTIKVQKLKKAISDTEESMKKKFGPSVFE